MDLPSLPTDSLYKFMFVAGIALIVISWTVMETKADELNKRYIEHTKERIEESAKLEKISLKSSLIRADYENLLALQRKELKNQQDELKTINDINKRLDILSTRIKNKDINLSKVEIMDSVTKMQNIRKQFENVDKEYELTNNKLTEDVRQKKSESDELVAENKTQSLLSNFNEEQLNLLNNKISKQIDTGRTFQIFGFVLLVIGLLKWAQAQDKQDAILNEQYKNILKYCQSCGMELKYDLNKQNDSIYCSHCYNGTSFNNPTLTFGQMKVELKKRMKENNLNFITKIFYLNRLSTLNRWKRDFKW